MNEEMLRKLTSVLLESEFSSIPPGVCSLTDIYLVVENRYPEFCDDKYL